MPFSFLEMVPDRQDPRTKRGKWTWALTLNKKASAIDNS